jgi:septal ring factor EnvC (AmiA/AmiB activator)
VGQVGDSTEEEAAGLYFEIRESRQSSDPRLWLR